MIEARVIRSEEHYHSYLEEIERLMFQGDKLKKQEVERLELLSILVEDFESRQYPLDPPDPVDAILFRMEEKGLRRADLIPYFGTSSRVSEVLGRKRPLTVQMIRALSLGLGIPTDILVGLSDVGTSQQKGIDWKKFPIKEMIKRGWLDPLSIGVSDATEGIVRAFLAETGVQFGATSFRRTLAGEAQSPTTNYAIYAWVARVIQRSRSVRRKLPPFDRTALSPSFLKELAQLSWSSRGPLLALEFLNSHGISTVVEPQLRGTQLDGAALQDVDGTPVIALTLRFDRLDSFWFTLLHEVAHVWKHVENVDETFVDDLNTESSDRREAEANRLAREAFIPRVLWKRSAAYISPSRETVEVLAKELRIHPAIVVGRLHRELGNFALLTDLMGAGEVRRMFSAEEGNWI